MSKIRTAVDLQTELDDEFAWRLKEIDDIRKTVKTSSLKRGLIRAGIAMNYAHWEGFVKQASEIYLEFVAFQKLKCKELKPNFVALGSRRANLVGEISNIRVASSYLAWIVSSAELPSDIPFEGIVKTRSNLSFPVFEEICLTLGLDVTAYSTKGNFINESLLKRRNAVAHGEFLDLDEGGYELLTNEVIALLRQFKNDIENSVSLGSFRKT